MTVSVSNRQRLLKVDTRRLKRLAEYALLDCRARTPAGFRAEARATAGNPAGLPALQTLSVVLVNDKAMAKLNHQFHHTTGPTDILSFDYGDGEGELIISVEHAIAQAKLFRTTPSRELALYIVHGLLHLRGFDDQTAARRRQMRAAERRLLASVARNHSVRGLIVERKR